MRPSFVEIGTALILGALLLVALWAQSLFPAFPHWNAGLSAFAFCVFAAYMVLVDDSLRPTKSAAHRMMVGILTGIVIAALNHAPGEGFLLGAMVGGILGWLGRHWAQHL
ncbi:MAG: hypothetical protein KA603_03975 [Azonexus sp.]|nr:hypothetical protein [Betaproteobacteria bacterium]MBK8919346.1 hypothetical protein [Betaproteobacteria bacterium]MBP6035276.1 hypothetical protein [Azonexus sp.]MBP6905859.1 hypothetical protein [Azonexus sp.]